MGVLHTPSRHTFECDGTQRVFPIPSLMISQDFVRIEIDGVLQSDRKQWDIVNNSLVFVEAPINGAILDVQVASDSESLGELGMIANVDILAQNINNVNKVANIDTDVTKVAAIDLDVTKVANIDNNVTKVADIDLDVTKVANIDLDVTRVADIDLDVTTVANIDTKVTTVADNILDIQNSEENATTAKEEAWRAEAERLTAKSYATEPENEFVKLYTSNNDGTFTVTDTTDYSSLHWEIKATSLVTTGVIDDALSSTTRTYSSNKIDDIVNTINGNITTIVTDNITPIENTINTIEGSITDLDNSTVKLTGNQAIEDVKTFTSSPIVPTPTTDFQTVNKKYVDDTNSINILSNKITPVDTDVIKIQESGGLFKKLSFANLKSWIPTLSNPIITGYAVMNGTTNNTIEMTGIVPALKLEVGDVIRIEYSGYNKLHTVETITNDNSIIVNYEHAGNRGKGSLRLPNITTSATISRITKWYNAPLGLGQAWVNVTAFRTINTSYASLTQRAIGIHISALALGSGAKSRVVITFLGGVSLLGNDSSANNSIVSIIAEIGSAETYRPYIQNLVGSHDQTIWVERR